MSTPYPPSSENPQQPGQSGSGAPSGPGSHPGSQPGHQPGQTGGYQQPSGQGYGSYQGYGQPQPTQQWNAAQQPPRQPQAPWGGGNAPYGGGTQKNFLTKLFDLEFAEFVTPQVAKVLYVLAMVLIGLTYIGYAIAAFTQSAVLGLVVLIVIGPLMALSSLILVRVSVEFYIAVIRLAEDVRDLKKKAEAR